VSVNVDDDVPEPPFGDIEALVDALAAAEAGVTLVTGKRGGGRPVSPCA
jgi:hypothetical protein